MIEYQDYVETDDTRIEDRADELFDQYRADAHRVREVDSEQSAELDESQYVELFAMLADMHERDADSLPGSDVLARLYGFARLCARMRRDALRELALHDAGAQIEAEMIEEGIMHAETAAAARETWL